MAITQEKNIEMLEKLADGNFKIKYPKTKAGQVIEETNKKFMTDAERTKLSGIAAGAQVNTVTSVAGKTGAVTLTKTDVGLSSVLNYGIATTAEAQAGTSNIKYMTPLRVKEAITQEGAIKYVAGSYVGDGASNRTINLGVQPKKMILHPTTDNSARYTLHYILGKWYGTAHTYLYEEFYNAGLSGSTLTILSNYYNMTGKNYIWEAWY